MLRPIFKNQKGDTIVEVLLAIAVIVAVLGASYALSNRSLQAGRAAQERGEALKVAETQLERLKAESSKQIFTSSYRISPGNYCIYDSEGTLTKAVNPNPAANNFDPNCRFGTNGRYTVNIVYTAIDSGPANYFGRFDVQLIWTKVGGKSTEQMTINYQL